MKYKVGDKVKIKSLDWYKANKCKGFVMCDGLAFIKDMTEYCGKELTIDSIYIDHNSKYEYTMKEPKIRWIFNDGMIEGLADELIEKTDDNQQTDLGIKMVSVDEVCNWLRNPLNFLQGGSEDLPDVIPMFNTIDEMVNDFLKIVKSYGKK